MSGNVTKALQVGTLPLAGLNAIEASAGTGKTWTIAALYLRLVLERALPVERILVVTFTKAATAELRSRIRARLVEARVALETGEMGKDVVLAEVLPQLDPARAQALLTLAIESFDLAAIYTIHGFCQRALAERAFESGQAFDAELMTDDTPLLREVVQDFWRRELAKATPRQAAALLARLAGPEALLGTLRGLLGKTYLQRRAAPPVDVTALAVFEAAFAKTQELWRERSDDAIRMLSQWPGLSQVSYKLEQIARQSRIVGTWLATDGLSVAPLDSIVRFTPAALEKGTTKKATATPTDPLFQQLEAVYDAAAALAEAEARAYGHFLQRALESCEAALIERKAQLNRQAFDDLLLRLHGALAGEGGEALAESLRARFGAALIDEFQDTDPLQYAIFKCVFAADKLALANARDHSLPPLQGEGWGGDGVSRHAADATSYPTQPHPLPVLPREGGGTLGPTVGANVQALPLFFVGDPKQAIYSFRGADLQAYLDARDAAGQPWVLGTNRRSTPALVAAVNALFGLQPSPFRDERLAFHAVDSVDEHDALSVGGAEPAPLSFWFMPRALNDKGKLVDHTKSEANRCIARAVAADIAELLNRSGQGAATLGEQPIAGGDIAILVKSHHQGRLLRDALAAVNVACVRYGQDSVFDTREAMEVERLLLAVAEPAREGRVRGALATDLLGFCGEQLFALEGRSDFSPATALGVGLQSDLHKPDSWDSILGDFHRWHALCRDRGFIAMWSALLSERGVAARLLAQPEGERRMTNLLHLSELLQQLAHDEGLDADALAKRLADERAGAGHDSFGSEARLLRLESDEHLVRIVTIHAAKGLEYPIVYCPFLWDGGKPRDDLPLRFHDPRDHRGALDFGSADFADGQKLAEGERRAEMLRLAYVALTRAKQRCVVVWGGIRDAEASPLAWLLHGVDGDAFKALDDGDLSWALARLQASAPGVEVIDLPAANDVTYVASAADANALQARHFTGHVAAPWRTHSFTAWLASGSSTTAEQLPDHDAHVSAPDPVEGRSDFSPTPSDDVGLKPDLQGAVNAAVEVPLFPRGSDAGSALHGIFEHGDFAALDAHVVERQLAAFGIEVRWADLARQWLSDVLRSDLDGSGLRLGDVPRHLQLRELEFLFPIAAPDMAALAAAIGPGQGADGRLDARVARLSPATAGGFLKGYIDLVLEHQGRLWLLDYKSNWLGPRFADYGPAGLAAAMAEEYYDLQALIYAVALHRLLRLRRPAQSNDDEETHECRSDFSPTLPLGVGLKPDLQSDQHETAAQPGLGGALYLFLRGMQSERPGSGVFRWVPDAALVARVDACLSRQEGGLL